MEEALLKTEELKAEGYIIFSFNEREIWFTDKETGKLRCIYKPINEVK